MTMALMLAVFAVGWRIPLPGIDLSELPRSYSPQGGIAPTFSIFALGFAPLFTVLAYAEIARLMIPPLRRWQARSSRNARRSSIAVAALALMLAAGYGYDVSMAFGMSDVVRLDAVGFAFVGLATFMASTALIIWMADNFGLPCVGGFWPVVAIAFLARFPEQAFLLIDFMRKGAISGGGLLLVGLSLAAGMALVAFANLLLVQGGSAGGLAKTSMLLWPPYLASVVAGYVRGFLPEMPDWPYFAPEVADLAVVVVCMPVFVFAYARLSARFGEPSGLPTPAVLGIAAIQIILCVGASLLPVFLGIAPVVSGGELLVVGSVMLALRGSPPDATRSAPG